MALSVQRPPQPEPLHCFFFFGGGQVHPHAWALQPPGFAACPTDAVCLSGHPPHMAGQELGRLPQPLQRCQQRWGTGTGHCRDRLGTGCGRDIFRHGSDELGGLSLAAAGME